MPRNSVGRWERGSTSDGTHLLRAGFILYATARRSIHKNYGQSLSSDRFNFVTSTFFNHILVNLNVSYVFVIFPISEVSVPTAALHSVFKKSELLFIKHCIACQHILFKLPQLCCGENRAYGELLAVKVSENESCRRLPCLFTHFLHS